MNGQWIGNYTGPTGGLIIVNVDELPGNYQGVANLNEDNKEIPSVAAFFSTPNKNKSFTFRTTRILAIHPNTGAPVEWDSIKSLYSANVAVSKYADVSGSWDDSSLSLEWVTELGVHGQCVLPRTQADKPSKIAALDMDWKGFKEYVATLEGRRFLFRGQSRQWRLRTLFHRTGRADLNRFLTEDIPTLHKHLSATTKHVFNLDIPNENGAFFNLIQHHGYPTPLLDWTYSPYVAAFFAYRGVSKERAAGGDESDKVRILVFDQAQWKKDWTQLPQLIPSGLHLSVLEFLAIENQRMIPQQAASTVTNIDDVETYVQSKEVHGKRYLYAIDLPVCARKQVMRELGYMGITAGAMFPGLDGACEELRERNFEV